MPVCPSGAEPIPGYSMGSLVLTLSGDALGDVAAMLGGLWGELAVQPVIARMSLDNLCAMNPDVPPPPTWDDLEAMTSMLPGGFSLDPAKPFPAWLVKQVQYHYFSISCRCINPAETVPPRPPVSTPPGTEPWPTDPGSQPQLTRIENNQSDASEALLTLYKGLQYTHSYASNAYFRAAPNLVDTYTNGPSWTMQGEGYHDLLPTTGAPGGAWQDVLGVVTQLTSIPSTVAQRGTLTPRLYGVGSIMWDAKQPANSEKIITRRDSIHYQTQAFLAPSRLTAYRLFWRLMPGVVASAQQLYYAVLDPHFMPTVSHDGQQPFHPFTFPPSWSDPPFYPQPAAARRVYALGSPP
jgi:hypothetical protein